jgi:hypothetical protein
MESGEPTQAILPLKCKIMDFEGLRGFLGEF